MVIKYKFDIDKSVTLLKVILSNFKDGICDFHKLFKILYFAEQKHLLSYGRTITGDQYIAMKDGPVPSNIYDLLKSLRGDAIFSVSRDLSKEFNMVDTFNVQLVNRNMEKDILSESELECISESIRENGSLSFEELSDKSHDDAWKSAGKGNAIKATEIAKAGGANDELLKYIQEISENKYHLALK